MIRDRETGQTGKELLERLERLLACSNGYQSPDGLAHVILWREGRGVSEHGVIPGMIPAYEVTPVGRHRDAWDVSLPLVDVAYDAGVA